MDPTYSFSDEPMMKEDLQGLFLGDFKLIEPIGSGAMADVWLAEQTSLGRKVALKLLKKEWAGDEISVRRFVQEAKAAARLEHANIIHIYEVGSLIPKRKWSFCQRVGSFVTTPFSRKSRENRQPIHYIAQEYVPGLNLQQYLRLYGPLPIRQVFVITRKIALALERAEQMGIVHRDVKPENILLSDQGVVKITDFGLAYFDALHQEHGMTMTQAGFTMGTPLYMSPEQAEGKPLDFRSDIYALGVTCFQMLTGRPPFNGESPLAVALQHVKEPLPDLLALRADVPDSFVTIVETMLAKQPEARYSSFKFLLQALQDAEIEFKERSERDSDRKDSSTTRHKEGASELFFLDERDRQVFQNSLRENELSTQLQTTLHQLESIKSKGRQGKVFTDTFRFWMPFLILIALFLGGGWAMVQRNSDFYRTGTSFRTSIARFESVEEQWIFASQLGTAEAWKSVILQFPEKEYWKRRAEQQLVRIYMKEGDLNRARPLFVQFTEISPSDPHYISFGTAGIAWCLVMEGNIESASSLLSKLRASQTEPFDRLTEEVITQTMELIRSKSSTINQLGTRRMIMSAWG